LQRVLIINCIEKMKQSLAILISTIIVAFMFAAPVYAKAYTFGIVPQQSTTQLVRNWLPVIRKIESHTGLKIKFATAKDIPAFEQHVREGLYDFVYMNPYHYTVFSETAGYKAIAKQSEKEIKGILVITKDSAIEKISDLNNKEIAFPAPAAFAATLLVKSYLEEQNVKYASQYVSSHDAVYRKVAHGQASVGGGIERTLKAIDKDIRDKLKIFWTSKGFTPHAFAYHPRVVEEDVAKFLDALLSLNLPGNETLLESIQFEGFEKADDSNWDDVRALNLENLEK